MTIRVVGAGVGRTGTMSLKLALEKLLGGRCYHMMEVFGRPDDVAVWRRAGEGDVPNWPSFLDEFTAIVDWPGASFWRELSEAFPDAVILLSTRADADTWWRSANNTIWEVSRRQDDDPDNEWHRMHMSVIGNRFTPQWGEEGPAKEAYERHNDEVRRTAPADRLVEWQPGDGWEPLCAALGVPVPDEAFPHSNSTSDFRTMAGLDS